MPFLASHTTAARLTPSRALTFAWPPVPLATCVSAGTVMVQAGPNQFSRGSTDTFIYPRLPFLGDLLQVSV